MPHLPDRRPAGFTLTELLITIGIIVLLIGILIPTVTAVRRSAWGADTRNTISQISGAITRYQLDFNAYPGVFSNAQVIAGTAPNFRNSDGSTVAFSSPVTASENLVLSLLGGIKPTFSGTTLTAFAYDKQKLGTGAVSLNPRRPHTWTAYMPADERIVSSGSMGDDVPNMNDNEIPEFVDAWPGEDRLPVLYMRALAGSEGIMSDGTTAGVNYQYDRRQIEPYLRPIDGLAGLGAMDAKIPEKFDPPETDPARDNALAYFKHPSVGGSANATGTPVEKDRFVLIAAGADRVFGTSDDIRSWGD